MAPNVVRGFDGRKRQILVNTSGFLSAVLVTAACVQDRDGARLLLAQLAGFCKNLRLIRADGASRAELPDWVAQRFSFCLLPALRSDDLKGALLSCLVAGSSNVPYRQTK